MCENFPFEGRPRRYRILSVSPELLMDALLSPRRDGGMIRVVRMEGLPDGCEIQAVTWDDLSFCFKFRLWHESFDVVPDGHVCPPVSPLFHAENVRVAENPAPAVKQSGFQTAKVVEEKFAANKPPERRGYEFL